MGSGLSWRAGEDEETQRFKTGRGGEWRRRKGREPASVVAGNPRVIWDHPGSSGVGGDMSMCEYVHVCSEAGGRQAETSALNPRAGLV